MPFDANLVLASDAAEWTSANLVDSNYGSPSETSRNTGGFVVIDLLAISTTPAKGLAAIFIATEAVTEGSDALTLLLQASDDLEFTYSATEDVHTLANFEVGGETHGIILGSECPCTVIRRFATTKRYIRVDASCVEDDDFGTCWVLLAPWPFNVL